MVPTKTKQWTVHPPKGNYGLQLSEAAVPALGSSDVLIQIHAASLNYRDLMISNGTYPWGADAGIVPGSDCAGSVLTTGSSVSRFQSGDRVMPIFATSWLGGTINPAAIGSSLGGGTDGVLRQYAVFNEQSLVPIPTHLSYEEASTLPCAAVTAWNALYCGSKPLRIGDTVVTQGTGGVSIFAAQFALKAGAKVIATTSLPAKAEKLKKLGVQHIINYKEDPEWGSTVRQLTDGHGAQYIIEVGGPGTLKQSSKAAAIDGEIAIIGTIGGRKREAGADLHNIMCATRRVFVGSRVTFEEMNKAIKVTGLRPVIDGKTFRLEELTEAYAYLEGQGHFGKVVVKIGDVGEGPKL